MSGTLDSDVLILGGGPAGATAGAVLARAGLATTIVEGDCFPRPHVGESLLPHGMPVLDRLGVRDAVAALPHSRLKEGATFVTGDGSRRVTYWFDEARPPAIPSAFQVRRDEFDRLLLDTAAGAGARVREGWRATAPLWDGKRLVGAVVTDPDGAEHRLTARAVLDATGQASFLATRMGWRFPYPRHRKVACFSHFRGVETEPGREAGNITIVVCDGGWAWLIPFTGGDTSVGLVLDVARWRQGGGGGPDAMFAAARAGAPELDRRLLRAEPVQPFQAIQNFSYRVLHVAGDGYCLVGDAAGFLDPIFSTGVFLGTVTGASAADDIIDALARHGRVETNDFAPTVTLTRRLHRTFFSLIRAYYDRHFLAFVFAPRPAVDLPGAMVSLLAGDVLRPGRWRRLAGFRLMRVLAQLQEWGERWNRPLVEPLPTPQEPVER